MTDMDQTAEGEEATPAASGEPVTVEIELGDLYVRPSSIEVPAGAEVIVNVTNKGAAPHDLKLDGETGTPMVEPGGQATASLGVVTESAQAWCTVPGHKTRAWCSTSTSPAAPDPGQPAVAPR